MYADVYGSLGKVYSVDVLESTAVLNLGEQFSVICFQWRVLFLHDLMNFTLPLISCRSRGK